MPTLHIHLDEAGDWNFNPKGSPYFVLTAVWTFNPKPLAEALTALRFSLIKQGISIQGFHAAPDKQPTRDAVVRTLLADNTWRFAAVVLEKRKVNPSLRDPSKFYPKFAGILLRFVLRGRDQQAADNVLVYADTIPIDTHAKREGVIKAVRTACVAELDVGTPHQIFSHCHESNGWIQVADYCCWAVQRKWQGSDSRTYDQLLPRLAKTELEITAASDGTMYY